MNAEDEIREVAQQVARKFKRKCWWADLDDLVQEAWMAALIAVRTFDPAVGVPLGGYLFRSATYALRTYLLRNSSPVSETSHHLHDLRGVLRAPLEPAGYPPAQLVMPGDAEASLDAARWMRSVDHSLRVAFMAVPDGDLAREVLVGERPAHELSDDPEVRHRAYKATGAARNRIAADGDLYDLWERRFGRKRVE